MTAIAAEVNPTVSTQVWLSYLISDANGVFVPKLILYDSVAASTTDMTGSPSTRPCRKGRARPVPMSTSRNTCVRTTVFHAIDFGMRSSTV
jgi:hypothetical protein